MHFLTKLLHCISFSLSYARTKLLSSMEHQTISSPNTTYLSLSAGNSFVVVSGLGGRSTRPSSCDTVKCPWFANQQNADSGVRGAALFCSYNYHGNENLAYCYLKDISGAVKDEFFVDVSGVN